MAGVTTETLASGQTEQLAGALVEAAAEKAELPAFLEGDELPEGYEMVELGPGENLLISVGLTPGSETVCYAGNVGVKLTRGEAGNIYFRLAGFDLPRDIFPHDEDDPRNTILTDLGPEGIPLGLKVRGVHLSEGRDALEVVGSRSLVLVKIPGRVQLSGKTADTAVLSGLSIFFSLGFYLEIGGKKVRIHNDGNAYGIRQKVVVPAAAVLRGAAAEGGDE